MDSHADDIEFRNRVTHAVRRRFGSSADVIDLASLSGGASAETWRFDVLAAGVRKPMILQRMAGAQQFEASLDRALQAGVQMAAAKAEVPVAEVAFVFDAADGLGNGYAMARLDGETLGPRILKQAEFAKARQSMTVQCGEILARIHRTPVTSLPPLPRRDAAASLATLESIYRRCGVELPVFELALQWLADHRPQATEPALVHGDFRLGNFIVGPDGIRAVLDWEMAHLGDPMEDFGWVSVPSWRYGHLDQEVGGFGKLDALIDAYVGAGGRAADRKAIRFWQVLGCLKWGLVCVFFAFQHLNGDFRSLERAAIGRRTSETELDLLALMQGG